MKASQWVEISVAEFIAAGRHLLGSCWEEGQGDYEAFWLGEDSPQRLRGDIFLLGWRRDQDPDPAARLALWKPASGETPNFFLYARDSAMDSAGAAMGIAAAQAWGAERNMKEWVGPLAFSTWHPYRFISRMGSAGFFPGEQKMPEAYAQDFLAAGFEAVAEYQSAWVEDLAQSLRLGLAMGVDRALGQVTVETLGRERLPDMLPELHRLSCDIFADNFGYAPLGLREFISLAAADKGGESALILARQAGKPAGFAFSYAIGSYAPETGRVPVPSCVLKTLGIHPDFRSLGLGYGLSYLTHGYWLERGKQGIIHAYMKSDNRSRSMSSHFGSAFRDYCLLRGGRAGV